MRVEYRDHVDIIDFVVPTVEMARDLIRHGAINGQKLLEDAGLSERKAKRELWNMLPGYLVFDERDESELPGES
jgi:hypothetical protein